MKIIEDLVKTSCYTGDAAGLIAQVYEYADKVAHNAVVSIDNSRINKATGAVHLYMQPPAAKAAMAAASEGNRPIVVISCQRIIVAQYLLYQWYLENVARLRAGKRRRCPIPLASRPGHSDHEDALAWDIADYLYWKPILQRHGFRWQGTNDRAHFSYAGSGVRHDLSVIFILAFQKLWNAHRSDKLKEDGQFGPKTEQALLRSPVEGF